MLGSDGLVPSIPVQENGEVMANSVERGAPGPRLEELTVDESLELLAASMIGRLAYLDDSGPVVLPVNYVMDGGAILLRTTYGALLDTVGSGARVAFEVDRLDAHTHTGWSVLVRGKAEEVWLPEELDHARALPLRSWAPGERSHFVRIFPSTITGRRIL
ncbi:MAG: pyridoxamine 5'-phosphate oxidase family protein [Nitriliruptorales bacterium]|nr:pyridoxamine 5'-phosphate oxidase family protein [Nitriliruptorales bacterium]